MNQIKNIMLKKLWIDSLLLLSKKMYLGPSHYTPVICDLCSKSRVCIRCNKYISCYNCYDIYPKSCKENDCPVKH